MFSSQRTYSKKESTSNRAIALFDLRCLRIFAHTFKQATFRVYKRANTQELLFSRVDARAHNAHFTFCLRPTTRCIDGTRASNITRRSRSFSCHDSRRAATRALRKKAFPICIRLILYVRANANCESTLSLGRSNRRQSDALDRRRSRKSLLRQTAVRRFYASCARS